VTKADIVDVIASATGLTKVETEAVVDGFITTVYRCDEGWKEYRNSRFWQFQSEET